MGLYLIDLGGEVRTDTCDRWLYVDSTRVLEKWGPGCHLFGFGNEEDINRLEALLEAESKKNPRCPPIASPAAEFPTLPPLHSPDLRRLRALVDKYEFPIAINQTIGNYANMMAGRSVGCGHGYVHMDDLTLGTALLLIRRGSTTAH